MSLSIILRDEFGNEISDMVVDTANAITQTIAKAAALHLCCARFIDPYDDTVFNSLQALSMVDEWDMLHPLFTENECDAIWGDIRKLIAECANHPHTYLVFIGD